MLEILRKHQYTCNFIVYYNSIRLCNSNKCPWIINYISTFVTKILGFFCLFVYYSIQWFYKICYASISLNFPRKYLWHTSFRTHMRTRSTGAVSCSSVNNVSLILFVKLHLWSSLISVNDGNRYMKKNFNAYIIWLYC